MSKNDVDRIGDDEKSDSGDGGETGESRARRCLELCHCRRKLLAIKVSYFAFFASYGVVIKYSPVFLKQHGLSAFEIGVIAGIRPLIGFLSAPVWGAVTDRYNIRRFLLTASLVAWIVFFTGLYMVREPVRRAKCPESMEPFLKRGEPRQIMDRDLAYGDNLTESVQLPTAGGSSRGASSSSTAKSRKYANAASFEMQITVSRDFSFPSSSVDERMFVNGRLSGRSNSSLLSEEDQELLREDLDWLYEPTSRYHVFIICLLLIVGGEFFQSPTTAITDAATLQILGPERVHQYGAQRAWGPIGWAIRWVCTSTMLLW